MDYLTLAADAGCFHDAKKADQMDHIADLNILRDLPEYKALRKRIADSIVATGKPGQPG